MFTRISLSLLCIATIQFVNLSSAICQSTWRAEVLPVRLEVGYAVLPIDMNRDGKLDIAIVDSKRFLWLENPSWTTHGIHSTPDAKNDNVCFAAHDVDADGRVDLAVGHDWQPGNSLTGGKIGWLRAPADPRQPWAYHFIAEEPTTHRMRWIDWDHDGRPELVVAPLKGKGSEPPRLDQTRIRLLAFSPVADSLTSPWPMQVIDQSLTVTHNLEVVDMNGDGKQELLLASFEGVTHLSSDNDQTSTSLLGSGQQGTPPAIGASEIRLGLLNKGARYLATIEPWHGNQVVVYTEPKSSEHERWIRHVLDEQLKWGHAVACANLDDDEDQELIIGVRDDLESQHRCGVRIYDPKNAEQGVWTRQLIEPGQVAVEDLAVGDFDDDGDIDIVAVGRATHNAVIYWNEK